MQEKEAAAREAVKMIANYSTVGLGAGSTMALLAGLLKQACDEGLSVKVLSSSAATAALLRQYDFVVEDTAAWAVIDLYFDGCDQFTPDLQVLKSGGGIHTMEKLLASMAREFIIVGDQSKLVESFDIKYPLTVEVLAEAVSFVKHKILPLWSGAAVETRKNAATGDPVLTTHGNLLLDIWFKEWPEPGIINTALKSITGIVETSLFYGMAHKAVIAGEAGVRILTANAFKA